LWARAGRGQPSGNDESLDRGDSDRLRAFGCLFNLELDPLIILEGTISTPTDFGGVDEQIFSTVVGSDKAKALIAVEPFDGSLCHIS
jgi:hypothetical protein